MIPAVHISVPHLSPRNPPPGNALMGIFKVYVDDSGDAPDPQHSVVSVAGYVSDVEHWSRFESQWLDVLQDHNVPYLHMKEWWDREGIYKEIKKDKDREANFFASLVRVIEENTTYCVSASIKLDDLRRFNAEAYLNLDTYSFALYACMIELRVGYPDEDIEIVIDKITKPYKRIGMAKRYAEMDTYADLKPSTISILPLEKEDSFKTILPIQAADFMAWELRKICDERKNWVPEDGVRGSLESVNADYHRWAEDFASKHDRRPRQRLSARGLERATPHKGYIWDYYNIRAADTFRHPHGWD